MKIRHYVYLGSTCGDFKFLQSLLEASPILLERYHDYLNEYSLSNGVKIHISQSLGFNLKFNKNMVENKNSLLPIKNVKCDWLVISSAQYAMRYDINEVSKMLEQTNSDIIKLKVAQSPTSFKEKACFTSNGEISGFYRQYSNVNLECVLASQDPHQLYIRGDCLKKFIVDDHLDIRYDTIAKAIEKNSLNCSSLMVSGGGADLFTKKGVYELYRNHLIKNCNSLISKTKHISDSAIIIGDVYIGKNVTIKNNVVVAGPTILGDNCTIGQNSIIQSALISSNESVDSNMEIKHNIYCTSDYYVSHHEEKIDYFQNSENNFSPYRHYENDLYSNFLKRWCDILISLSVLLLFTPVILLLSVAIKISSPGPVFFGHQRQGRHGKPFKCWKFRTMMIGADDLQQALRGVNEVDGPQFKMDNDPRIFTLGNFLRETCLDEIPQFYNVLLGEMALVGPRPSPEVENASSPPWRDARLSVRPGITGLWQVMRTRAVSQDFQEWLKYDTDYIKDIRLHKDIWICWATIKQIAKRTIQQF